MYFHSFKTIYKAMPCVKMHSNATGYYGLSFKTCIVIHMKFKVFPSFKTIYKMAHVLSPQSSLTGYTLPSFKTIIFIRTHHAAQSLAFLMTVSAIKL